MYRVIKVELGYVFLQLCGHAHGWFHFKIPKKIGGACFVCVVDVTFLGTTLEEHGSLLLK